MNSIAAETGLHVICLQIEVGHVAGVANYEADVLSRQCQGKAFPCRLAEVQRAATPCRKFDFFLAWSGDSPLRGWSGNHSSSEEAGLKATSRC